VRIKICGLTRVEDARLAVTLGADYLGFIFAQSPRRVTPAAAAAILHSLRQERTDRRRPLDNDPVQQAGVQRVGVFVNAERQFIEEAAREAGLTLLQLHGDETPEFCSQFALPVIKALRIKDRGIFEQVERYQTPYILLEPYVRGRYGGTGMQADWQLAAELVRTFPQLRFILAGGLGPENVRAALAAVDPYAVDASSGLESHPGVKDSNKLKAFIRAVRNRS
jgi:phosphoribosylanthranilate isomerase